MTLWCIVPTDCRCGETERLRDVFSPVFKGGSVAMLEERRAMQFSV